MLLYIGDHWLHTANQLKDSNELVTFAMNLLIKIKCLAKASYCFHCSSCGKSSHTDFKLSIM